MRVSSLLAVSVFTALSAPAALAAEAGTPLFEDPTTWAAIALVVFFGVAWYFGLFKQVFGALDNRAEEIRKELEQARRLREEAQKVLAETERAQREAEESAGQIIEQAKADALAMQEQARKDLAERLERRERQAEDRIARATANAEQEVRNAAADAATQAAAQVLSGQAGDDQFAKALGEIKRAL